MRLTTPYQNLKGFASSRPPLMIFVLCLGLFGFVLMSLAYYVKLEEIQPPDPSKDWNVFLENFAHLEFCISANGSNSQATTVEPPSETKAVTAGGKIGRESPSPTPEASTPTYDGPRNYSIPMMLDVTPTRDFLNIPHNLTHLTGTIYGRDIGLIGQAGSEDINVTMELPFEWSSTHCNDKKCEAVKIYACVHLQAAPSVFPPHRSPQMCESLNDTGIEYSARIRAQEANQLLPHYCKSRPRIKVTYKLDAGMTMWLNLNDRSVINLHLMHTSYFLFVMVIMVFCYAIIRGRPHITKIVHAENGYTQAPDHD